MNGSSISDSRGCVRNTLCCVYSEIEKKTNYIYNDASHVHDCFGCIVVMYDKNTKKADKRNLF